MIEVTREKVAKLTYVSLWQGCTHQENRSGYERTAFTIIPDHCNHGYISAESLNVRVRPGSLWNVSPQGIRVMQSTVIGI